MRFRVRPFSAEIFVWVKLIDAVMNMTRHKSIETGTRKPAAEVLRSRTEALNGKIAKVPVGVTAHEGMAGVREYPTPAPIGSIRFGLRPRRAKKSLWVLRAHAVTLVLPIPWRPEKRINWVLSSKQKLVESEIKIGTVREMRRIGIQAEIEGPDAAEGDRVVPLQIDRNENGSYRNTWCKLLNGLGLFFGSHKGVGIPHLCLACIVIERPPLHMASRSAMTLVFQSVMLRDR
jgi:hypothetical protein